MAATFQALDDFLDDWLELPVLCKDGQTRVFRIPSPPAEDGLRVDQLTTAAARMALGGSPASEQVLDDEGERDLFKLALGDMYDEIASQVGWTRFRHVAMTAMVWITSDREKAAIYWATGGDAGKMPAPNRAARRSQSNASSASAAASTTRSRGSTSGTKAGSHRGGSGKGKGGRTRSR